MPNREPPNETRFSLIQRVSQLDPESWNQFVTLYDSLLLAYIGGWDQRNHYGLDAHDLEDIKQEVLLKLWSSLSTYKPPQRFRTWLWQVTCSVVIDWIRKQRGRSKRSLREAGSNDPAPLDSPPGKLQPRKVPLTAQLEESLVAGEGEPDEQLIQAHDQFMLRFLLEKVKAEMGSSPKWMCFEMRYLESKPGREVAEKLGISEGSVHINVFRVLRRIRELCRDYDVDLPTVRGTS